MAEAAEALRVGSQVQLHSLQAAAQHNGAFGTCGAWNPDTGRWDVKLSTGHSLAVRPTNLKPVGKELQIQSITDTFYISAYDGGSGYDTEHQAQEMVHDDDPETVDIFFQCKWECMPLKTRPMPFDPAQLFSWDVSVHRNDDLKGMSPTCLRDPRTFEPEADPAAGVVLTWGMEFRQ